MTNTIWMSLAVASAAFAPAATAQTPVGGDQAKTPKYQFEVASIRSSPDITATNSVSAGVHIDGAHLRCSFLSLRDYLMFAYQLKHYQISVPSWMSGARFEIQATIPEGAPRDQVPEMMKALLVERFGMKVHLETKEFPVYALTVAKTGLKIKETPTDADAEAEAKRAPVNVAASGGPQGVTVNLGNGSFFTMADNKMTARKLPMDGFADTLARMVDRPVVNQTNLTGNYDFDLSFTPEDFRSMHIRSAIAAGVNLPPEALKLIESSGDSIFSALSTVGLKLEPRKAPLEFLVVDASNKTPTEN